MHGLGGVIGCTVDRAAARTFMRWRVVDVGHTGRYGPPKLVDEGRGGSG
jgi:hypothetical protein